VTYRIGIDVGGTFTDFLVVDMEGGRLVHKTPSIPADPARAVLEGLSEIAGGLGLEPASFAASIELIVHGTTVATNALLTRRGAVTGLLCTEGHRDVLPLRDGMREEPYNNRLPVPIPLVPRYRRIGIGERLDYAGREVRPLPDDQVREAAVTLGGQGVEAVAICFVHAATNPEHERRAAEIVREVLPGVHLTVSSELIPQLGLFDRTSTAVLNAYVAPIMTRYVSSLTSRLAAGGFTGLLLLMQSNGGVAAPAEVSARAVGSLLSGPASGPTAGLLVTAPLDFDHCITVDMGGTSFDAAVVKDGRPLVMTDGWVDRWRLALPMVDIHSIGAGGGSIAYVTSGGLLRVGPASAAADPGPACYGRGGRRATVTDADLLLGYLAPDSFLGGRMRLDRDAAKLAVEEDVAGPLGLDTLRAAAGVFQVVNVSMAAGIREITLGRGLDPRDFPLVVAGGAGPIHAAAIAAEMDIPVLVVPRESSILCAAGMLMCDFQHDYVRSRKALLDDLEPDELGSLWDQMRTEGLATLRREGLSADRAGFVPSLDLRYRRQWHELNVPVEPSFIDDPDRTAIEKAFHGRHEDLFGYATPGTSIEVMNVRLSVTGRTDTVGLPSLAGGTTDPAGALLGERAAWSQRESAMVSTPVYDGAQLGRGAQLAGPAIIELATTTVVLSERYRLMVDRLGSFVLYLPSHQREVRAAGSA
jgi:N-methylhydantoinase A